MRALLSTYGSGGDVEPMVGLAVRALGAKGCDALVATGVMTSGVRLRPGMRQVIAGGGPMRLSMQRTHHARAGALLPQSAVRGRSFARGR